MGWTLAICNLTQSTVTLVMHHLPRLVVGERLTPAACPLGGAFALYEKIVLSYICAVLI